MLCLITFLLDKTVKIGNKRVCADEVVWQVIGLSKGD
jgi:hypothetical protein